MDNSSRITPITRLLIGLQICGTATCLYAASTSSIEHLQATVGASSVVPVVVTVTPSASGGIVPTILTTSRVTVSGVAAPLSVITIMYDGTRVGSALADAGGNFTWVSTSPQGGTHIFSFFVTDDAGRVSPQVSVGATVPYGSASEIRGIVVPPTLAAQYVSLIPGDTLVLEGKGAPGTRIYVKVERSGIVYDAIASPDGSLRISIPTQVSDVPMITVTPYVTTDQSTTPLYYPSSRVSLGLQNIRTKSPDVAQRKKCDIVTDERVNLFDFSILSYWFKIQIGYPKVVDLNTDGELDLQDLSVLMYCWTG